MFMLDEVLNAIATPQRRVSFTDDILSLDVPGFKKDDISVSVENEVLTISGSAESRGSITRKWRLPDGTNTDQISAKLSDGVLEVSLPRLESSGKIEVQVQ